MGKNPAFLFYPGDWTRDLDDQDIEIEGAWIRICCRLWWSETRGEMTKPLKEWARILRKTEQKTIKIFQILIEKRIADGTLLDNQNINLISRRIKRDFEISKIRREVGRLGGNPGLKKIKENLLNQTPNQKCQPSVSVSVSVSSSKKKVKNIATPIPDDFKISDRVRKWADKKYITRLDEHLENFILACNAKGYKYENWDAGFMMAIRNDWAKLGGNNAGTQTDVGSNARPWIRRPGEALSGEAQRAIDDVKRIEREFAKKTAVDNTGKDAK